MRILWANAMRAKEGVFLGYSLHAAKMREALEALGVDIIDEGDDFDVAVHITLPDMYIPRRGRGKDLLFTMHGTTALPYRYVIEQGRQPDIFVVPCQFVKGVFAKYYTKPIEICPEGIDPLTYPFHPRKKPQEDQPFRFLFVGAFGPRKGMDIAGNAFTTWLRSGMIPRNAQLYIKTSGLSGGQIPYVHYLRPDANGRNFVGYSKGPSDPIVLPGIVLDSRADPPQALNRLYQSAHAFLLPSRGEGWGLTLSEALATGLPATWTHWGGPVDFADEKVGFHVEKYRMVPHLESADGSGGLGADPDPGRLLERMAEIYHNYGEALSRGKLASERMHTRFTWKHAAQRFIEICERYAK